MDGNLSRAGALARSPPPFDELVYSRRLMLHMLFGADPSTFARVYTAKDAA